MDELLLFLLKKGANKRAIRLTTTEISGEMGMSQQNVSRRLKILEDGGEITRERGGISISGKGIEGIKDLRAVLENAFSAKIKIYGKVVGGLGEGRFYLSQQGYIRQMKEKLGFDPYPGTLNIKLDRVGVEKRRRLLAMDPIIIEGFVKAERKFGDLFAYRAKIDGEASAILVPLRTHHGSDTLEIASADNLRKRFKLKEGDLVGVEIE
jgi:riboflavin kinase